MMRENKLPAPPLRQAPTGPKLVVTVNAQGRVVVSGPLDARDLCLRMRRARSPPYWITSRRSRRSCWRRACPVPYDPDEIKAGKLRYLATFLEPPGATQNQNTFGRPQDAPAAALQAYVSLEGVDGLELISAEQLQVHVVYVVTCRWSPRVLAVRAGWEMTINWPLQPTGSSVVTRTFELKEPPQDKTGRRRRLTFKVVESTKTTGG